MWQELAQVGDDPRRPAARPFQEATLELCRCCLEINLKLPFRLGDAAAENFYGIDGVEALFFR